MANYDITGIADTIEGVLNNPVATAIGGALVGGALAGTVVGLASSSKKKTRKSSKSKSRKSKRKKSRKTTYARTAGKRKDTSRRRIRQTKTGQPYIILASGKARFISKASARNSRRRKGGRY